MLVLRGCAYKLERIEDDVNCDYIISGKYKFQTEDRSFLSRHIFENIEPGMLDRINRGDFLIAGYNFGCGSTREQAIQTLIGAGLSAVIAKSFAHTFYRNAFNNGLLLIECNTDYVENKDELEIDLKNHFLRNATQKMGIKIGNIDPAVLKIYSDGGLINHLKKNRNRYNL